MNRIRSLTALLVIAAWAPAAMAQAPSARPGGTSYPPRQTRTSYRPARYDRPLYDPTDSVTPGERSILRQRTAPYQRDDMSWGFRNPGGVGRHAEYYPPGNVFQNGNAAPYVARFDGGPAGTTRRDQMQAQAIGNQRTYTLQQHIDNYSRPLGFGYGFGYGGFGYPFPY